MLNSYEGVGGTTFSVNFSTQKYRIFDPFFKGFFHILGVNIILGGGGWFWGSKKGHFGGILGGIPGGGKNGVFWGGFSGVKMG